MLENLNLEKKLSNDEYKRIVPGLQARLYDLEKACWDNGVPTVVVFEGWDASGKGTAIARAHAAARSPRIQGLSRSPRRAPTSSSGRGCGASG